MRWHSGAANPFISLATPSAAASCSSAATARAISLLATALCGSGSAAFRWRLSRRARRVMCSRSRATAWPSSLVRSCTTFEPTPSCASPTFRRSSARCSMTPSRGSRASSRVASLLSAFPAASTAVSLLRSLPHICRAWLQSASPISTPTTCVAMPWARRRSSLRAPPTMFARPPGSPRRCGCRCYRSRARAQLSQVRSALPSGWPKIGATSMCTAPRSICFSPKTSAPPSPAGRSWS